MLRSGHGKLVRQFLKCLGVARHTGVCVERPSPEFQTLVPSADVKRSRSQTRSASSPNSSRDLGRNERTRYELFKIAATKAHGPMPQFYERNLPLENPGSNSGRLEAQKGRGLWHSEEVSLWNNDCLGHGRKSPCVYCQEIARIREILLRRSHLRSQWALS